MCTSSIFNVAASKPAHSTTPVIIKPSTSLSLRLTGV